MFFEQLSKACKNKGKTVTAVAKELKISKSNVTNWKNGTTPNGEVVVRLSELLDVTADYLLKDGVEINFNNISADEKELLSYYKELDDYEKGRVIGKAEELAEAARRRKAELEAATKEKAKPKLKAIPFPAPEPEPGGDIDDEDEESYIYLPLSYNPASAGTGVYLDGDYVESVKVRATPEARRSDFAVKVSGDSMEPRFRNGDIVLVSKEPVEIGETGIFVYEGDGYIKQLGKDCLISINPAYPDIQIKDRDSFFCQGKVVAVLSLNKRRN